MTKHDEILPDETFSAPVQEPADTMPADWSEPEGVADPEQEDSDEEQEPPRRRRRVRMGQIVTGSILSSERVTYRLPVVVYVVFLMLLYIANGFHMQSKHNRLDKITEEIKQLKTIAVTTSAVRMTRTRQSEIERLLKEHKIPLITDEMPPRVIE